MIAAGEEGVAPDGTRAITAIDVRAAISLARPVSLTPPAGVDANLWCAVPLAHAGFAAVDRKDEVLAAFRRVHAAAPGASGCKRALVIALAYFEGLTIREIGTALGMSESRVCQLHARALASVRPEGARSAVRPGSAPG